MLNLIRKITFLVIFLIFAVSVRPQERYVFSNLSLKDGLPQITVLCIHQDRDGYMWFGTRNGLNRYDGYNFYTYKYDAENPASISDNHILCMAEDGDGHLWVGTNNGLNRLDISTNTFTRYFSISQQPSSLGHNIVNALCYDEDGNLWVGTRNGLSLYDPKSDAFIRVDVGGLLQGDAVNVIVRHEDHLYLGTTSEGVVVYNVHTQQHQEYSHHPEIPGSIPHNYIRALLIDRHGTLWVGTRHDGVCYKKKGEDRFQVFDASNGLTSNYIRCVEESPDGKIIVGTFNGISVIDPVSGNIERYATYGTAKGNLSHYSVFSVFFDRSETLWVGTYSGGLDYASKYRNQFQFYSPELLLDDYFGILGAILETEEYVYFASEGMGLLEWNKESDSFHTYNPLQKTDDDMTPTIIKSIYRAGDNTLFCATNVGTIYTFDLKTKKFQWLYSMPEEDPIYYLDRNGRGELMIGSVTDPKGLVIGGQDRFQLEDGSWQTFSNVRCLLEIAPDRYLIGTRNDGLYDFDRPGGELIQYKLEKEEDNQPGTIPDNYISILYRDKSGNIWLGTFGGGFALFDPQTGRFEPYSTKDGLLDDNICSIIDDGTGHLWISTMSGISDFNVETRKFTNYTINNGIGVNEFTPHSGMMLSNGRIAFSGNNGFVTFDPASMDFNPYIPPVVLRNLYLGNDLVMPGDDTGILSRQINDQEEIVLKYDQSNISIEYSALNYIFSERNQYMYRLEGFDNQWNSVGTRRMAYYTNIPPGKYRFAVRGSNNDGYWNEQVATIGITVLPPWWKTGWAYGLYLLLGAAIVVFVIWYFSERKRLENDIKLKQAEARAQTEFHEARDKLFTNFSHELRTPLTLIMSPLGDMIEQENELSPKVRENLTMMQGNARRLLRLVNNLMDFQKKESGKLQLKLAVGDFIDFSQDMTHAFTDLARSRDILLEFKTDTASLNWWFDRNLMDKVFFNFLSNAFKNTPNGGNIEVVVSCCNLETLQKKIPVQGVRFTSPDLCYILLEIKDSGSGIPSEELEKIFIPFYQVAQNEHSSSGTGLGLSLSKAIIEMHHGMVWAESPDETGAVFRVILPVDNSIYGETDPAEDYIDSESRGWQVEVPVRLEGQGTEESGTGKTYTVLIAEDNPDVRNYLVSHLSASYHTLEAPNGADAFDKATVHLPDLVITDLMMPKMDGIELAAKLKKDLRTSHIPIIMITAKAMSSDIRKGYETGADDYIVKPFNSSVLMARVENLIRTRENLKTIYGKRFDLDTLGVKVASVDERFMNKVYGILEQNLANPEFNLDYFSQEIGMSRANLYRKIKSVTNLSPNEFIRNFRLEMAANMLKEARMPVSDVYVAVGFSSHAYFSNCFKALYGITPSEYAASASSSKQ